MPNLEDISDLRSMIETAESTFAKLEKQVLTGNDAQVDELSKKYEDQIEKILTFKGQTQQSLIAKLDFFKTKISEGHPAETFVLRVFESLSEDVRSLKAEQ